MNLTRSQRNGLEFIGFVILAIIMMVIGAHVIAAIPSAVGYVIFLSVGQAWTFWTGAAAGFGALVMAAVIIAIIKALRG